MVSEFTGRPKLLKGALVAFRSQLIPGVPTVVVFQYNPENLTRTLKQRSASGGESAGGGSSAAQEVLQVTGPPDEQISMTAVLDAADQLEQPGQNPDTVLTGLHPALATLELLLYPPSEQILANAVRAALGARQITTTDAPLTLLVWGPARVVPVRLTGFTFTEKAFDQLLNPIRAEVRIDVGVLTYRDLEPKSIGHGVSVVHHVSKEVLSAVHQVKTAIEIVGSLPF
ncbi:hypothetical protein [Geodermatophilus sp. URMC 60]